MKIVAAAMLLIASIPVHAQINKCKGPDGKIVYQDTPCTTAVGQELNIQNRPTAPTYGETDSDRQARRDIEAARQIDRDREQRKIDAASDRRMREFEKQAKADRCARYENSAARAKYWADRTGDSAYRDLKKQEADGYGKRYADECR